MTRHIFPIIGGPHDGDTLDVDAMSEFALCELPEHIRKYANFHGFSDDTGRAYIVSYILGEVVYVGRDINPKKHATHGLPLLNSGRHK